MNDTEIDISTITTIYESLSAYNQIQLLRIMEVATDMELTPINELLIAEKRFLEDYPTDNYNYDDRVPTQGSQPSPTTAQEDSLIAELEQLYNPVLMMQQVTSGATERIAESNNLLVENNIIKLDRDTYKAQLVSLCARLLARSSNSADWNAYVQAKRTEKMLRTKMDNEYNAAANVLANKYLQKIINTNGNSDLKLAAQNLLTVGTAG